MKTLSLLFAGSLAASVAFAQSETIASAKPNFDVVALRASAEQGSTDAMLELGFAHDSGIAGAVDRAEAAQWYRRAAMAGVGEAHLWLGQLQETGDGVPRDLAAARASYEAAVAAGVVKANFRLGLVYFEGWGVPRDAEKGVSLFTIAAEADYVPAQRVLADVLMLGIRVPKDEARGLAWAERAALADDRDAQLTIGKALAKGVGGARDLAQARTWYQLSAEQEYSIAMLAMAQTFLSKTAAKTPQNLKQGVRWLMLADQNGSGYATFALAGFHAVVGHGKPGADEKARAFFEKAAAGGNRPAAEVLKLAADGKSLRDAYTYVARTPYEQRYVDRLNAAPRDTINAPPRAKTLKRPDYPAAFVVTKITGNVVVSFVVQADGTVSGAKVVSSTHPGFEENALAAVAQWTFEPALKDGRAVKARMQVPVMFELPK